MEIIEMKGNLFAFTNALGHCVRIFNPPLAVEILP